MGELLCTGAMPASRGIPECKSIHENGNAEEWFPAAACYLIGRWAGRVWCFFINYELIVWCSAILPMDISEVTVHKAIYDNALGVLLLAEAL